MSRRFPDGLSTEDLAELVLGCLQAIDTFGSATNVKPAKSRWWTMAAVVSKQALHLLLYDILPKSLAGAFPWKDIGEPSLEVHDGQDTADNDYRKMIRSKCRRAIVYTKAFELRRLGLCITLCVRSLLTILQCVSSTRQLAGICSLAYYMRVLIRSMRHSYSMTYFVRCLLRTQSSIPPFTFMVVANAMQPT